MIIRRRHTANYTTISNTLFRDNRLAADEVGILGYLLSQPHDWEVRRPALARRWKYGREAIRRVVHNCIKYGWCVPHRTRLPNGTFHIIYEIRDEPGPEMSDEEVRSALSLVSSGAAQDQSDEESAADDPETHPPSTGDPHTGYPSTVDHTTVTRSGPIEGLLTTGSQTIDSTNVVRDFAQFREAWNQGDILSPIACEKLFLGLSDIDKQAAFNAMPKYLSDCRAKNRKVCDLSTFLRERRFERFRGPAVTACHIIKPGTPQGFRWREHKIAEGTWSPFLESQWKQGKAWTERSEWPPGQSGKAGEAFMTSDDERELARG